MKGVSDSSNGASRPLGRRAGIDPRHRPSSRRVLIAAFVASTTSFLIATMVSEYNDVRIRAASNEIVKTISPRIEYAATMRSDVRRLEVLLDDYVDAAAASVTLRRPITAVLADRRDRIGQVLQLVHVQWTGYQAVPHAVDRTLWPVVTRTLEEVDRAVAAALLAIDNGDGDGAIHILESVAKPTIDRFDRALVELADTGVLNAERLGALIAELSHRSIVSAIVLDGISVALTAVLALLLYSTIRYYTRLQTERADELERFAERVAHDILSPLSAVGLSLSLIERHNVANAKISESAGRGARGLARVHQLVEALLDFARAGAHPVPGARADVTEVLTGLMEEAEPLAHERGVQLEVESFAPCQVACSRGVLMSLVGNLVRNALKYIGEGQLRQVTIRVAELEDDVRIEVRDTGPGLPSDLGERAFEPYVRGANQDDRNGIGIGLATVKRLVEAHGGGVGVESTPGVGCCFWLRLPKASAELPARHVQPPEGEAIEQRPGAA